MGRRNLAGRGANGRWRAPESDDGDLRADPAKARLRLLSLQGWTKVSQAEGRVDLGCVLTLRPLANSLDVA